MGEPTPHSSVLLLLAAFSRYDEALDWAKQHAAEYWGPIALESPRFDFVETGYYDATMGPGLKKVFFAFQRPFDPERLVEIKLLSNRWEEEYAATVRLADSGPGATKRDSPIFADLQPTLTPGPSPESGEERNTWTVPRPLNLDPGYLTPGKLVLASTKDFAHRIYLSQGIYAEVTLQYKHRTWKHHEYTFPDYRRADYQRFLSECREIMKRMRDEG
jgi:hypothetical protein